MGRAGILIARLQTPWLNHEIRALIKRMLSENDEVVFVLGKTKAGITKRNPLDFEIRKSMVSREFPSLKILPLDDHPSDIAWSEHLDDLIKNNFPGHQVLLYGSGEGFVRHYKGNFNVSSTGNRFNPDISANEHSEPFRKGVVYGLGKTYSKVYPTVDIALFRDQKSRLLLGKKSIDSKWRFPGGFTDPDDESYEAAVKRELNEECSIDQIDNLMYEKSFKVDDWRYREEEDKIITILFSADLHSGHAKANDDIAEVKWFDLSEVSQLATQGMVAPEHAPLFSYVLKKYL